MQPLGYYQQPHLHSDHIVFVCEEEIWITTTNGGTARRLTAGRGGSANPFFSPDGTMIAFSSKESGPKEVYVMPSSGGIPQRLSYCGNCTVVGWTPDGQIIFTTNRFSAFSHSQHLCLINPTDRHLTNLPWGDAVHLHYGPRKDDHPHQVVLCRHHNDLAYWKRYRGGRVGVIWIDTQSKRQFQKLIDTGGNVALPLWIQGRIYFISDHEFIGNIYSCLPDGTGLQKHTEHKSFFVRRIATDGHRLIYTCGSDIYILDPQRDQPQKIIIHTNSDRRWQQAKFIHPGEHLSHYHPSKEGKHLVITSRGKAMAMANWEGSIFDCNQKGCRQRLATFFPKSQQVLTLSTDDSREVFVIHHLQNNEVRSIENPAGGRPVEISISPDERYVAFSNHRQELYLLDLETEDYQKIDHSPNWRCKDLSWSPQGGWLAYCWPSSIYGQTSQIRLYEMATGKIVEATDGHYPDSKPSFHPKGTFLCFLSSREFSPVYDRVYFDLGFTWGDRPYLLTLQEDTKSPFEKHFSWHEDSAEPSSDEPSEEHDEASTEDSESEEEDNYIHIDLEGLVDRIVPFPVPESRYGHMIASEKHIFILELPSPKNGIKAWYSGGHAKPQNTLHCYNLEKQEWKKHLLNISDFKLDPSHKNIIYRSGSRLRVHPISAGADLKASDKTPGRKTGWVDLSRITLRVNPVHEWRQMFRETWQLMRDHFWAANMSHVDWNAVYDRYHPLLERVAIRSEYSDLVKEMFGELGTSHAYEMMGDHRSSPTWQPGWLGADFIWDDKQQGYRIIRIVKGEPGFHQQSSPLSRPGIKIHSGDILQFIDGQRLSPSNPPSARLMNKARKTVQLGIIKPDGEIQHVSVKPLASEQSLRYRDWVCRNREYVHQKLGGKVGYVHVPDMGPAGFAAFHQDYLKESLKDGLIVDFRFNRGGHVSQLIIEKLARTIIGYNYSRWGSPAPYPAHAVRGPIVGLTNECAGSDGDIGPHAFKHLQIGTLVGTRSWGGVVGISPRFYHVDGGLTTQPEFANWFVDIEWGLENHGTEPDIVVDFPPQDHANGHDPQLNKALEVITKQLQSLQPLPSFGNRPNLWHKE